MKLRSLAFCLILLATTWLKATQPEIGATNINGNIGFKINGVADGNTTGWDVSDAGDVNGDGLSDVIIGAPTAVNGGGEAYVVFGTSSIFYMPFELSDINGLNGFRLKSGSADSNIGFSVSAAGDVNADGVDDLIIGAQSADAAYVVFGNSEGFDSVLNLEQLNGQDGFKITGESSSFGRKVSNAGDVDGDGIDDFMISNESNAVYLIYGKTTKFPAIFDISIINGRNGFKIIGGGGSEETGHSIALAGDINADGVDDLIISAPLADSNGNASGTTYVLFGNRKGFATPFELTDLDGSNGFLINGELPSDLAGDSASGAGDINGDGIDDLIIGAPLEDTNGDSAGAAYVIFGKVSVFSPAIELSNLDVNDGFKINGVSQSDRFGYSVSAAGDHNGDGIGDVVIGAIRVENDVGRTGASYLIYGNKDGFPSTFESSAIDGNNGFKINGEDISDFFGSEISVTGDVNGDGLEDIVISAPGAFGANKGAGTSYIVYGSDVLFITGFESD